MKSSIEQLRSRGFANDEETQKYVHKSFDELIQLLKSITPSERTISARLLARNNSRAIKHLGDALHLEKKLYTKIEISNSLASYGILAVPILIDSL